MIDFIVFVLPLILIGFVLLYFLGGIYLPLILIGAIIAYVIYDYKKYPNKFRGKCKYCGVSHGRNQWWIQKLGKELSYENGYIFLSKECRDNWERINFICENCTEENRKDNPYTFQLRHERKNLLFCNRACKEGWEKRNPGIIIEHQRHSIPTGVRKAVWKRDEEKCVKCGSNQNIEFDHIVPVSKGGSSTINNVELLCEHCNRTKSDKIE